MHVTDGDRWHTWLMAARSRGTQRLSNTSVLDGRRRRVRPRTETSTALAILRGSYRQRRARTAAAASLSCVMRRPPLIMDIRGGRRHTCACRLAAAVLVIFRRARIDDDIVGGRRTCTRPAAAATDAIPARWRRAHLSVRLPWTKRTRSGRRRPLV